jgi:hypothetical protein
VNGPVPHGHHVHHVDFDHNNNAIENLQCIPAKEHLALHAKWDEERIIAARRHLDAIRPLSKAWHSSPEGREKHKEIGAKAYANFKPKELSCAHCGAAFMSRKMGHSDIFCGNACKSAHRRKSGVDDIDAVCICCGAHFRKNKYSDKQSCSRACGSRVTAQKKSARLRADSQ